jgi:pimeloyl-ACP methyl ester carboxylesterase
MIKIFIKNRLGLKICMQVEENPHAQNLVFIEHGMSATKDHPYIKVIGETFTEHNYTVVTFDATNSVGESAGHPEDLSFYTHYHDLEDTISWAKTQSWFKAPFAICGHSLGAMSAIKYSEENPSNVNLLIPIAPATNGKNLAIAAELKTPGSMALWQKYKFYEKTSKLNGKVVRVPYSLVASMDVGDVLPQIEKIICPTHIIIGEADTSVLPAQAQDLFKRLTCQKSFQLIPSCPHSMYESKELKALKLALDKVLANQKA